MPRQLLLATTLCFWAGVLIPTPVQSTVSPLVGIFGNLLEDVVGVVGNVAANATGEIGSLLGGTPLDAIGNLLAKFGSGIDLFTGGTQGLIGKVTGSAEGVVHNVLDRILDGVLTLLGLSDIVEIPITAITQLLSRVLTVLPKAVQKALTGTITGLLSAIAALGNAVKMLVGGTSHNLEKLVNLVLEVMGKMFMCIGDWGGNENFGLVVNVLLQLVVKAFGTMGGTIISGVSEGANVAGLLLGVVGGAVIGVLKGSATLLKGGAKVSGALVKFVDTLISNAVDVLKKSIDGVCALGKNPNMNKGTLDDIVINLRLVIDELAKLGGGPGGGDLGTLLSCVIAAVDCIVELLTKASGDTVAKVVKLFTGLIQALVQCVLGAVLKIIAGAGKGAVTGVAGVAGILSKALDTLDGVLKKLLQTSGQGKVVGGTVDCLLKATANIRVLLKVDARISVKG